MERNERFEDPQIAFLTALLGQQAEVWTALPGIVQRFDPDKKICDVQPAIQAMVTNTDGSRQWTDLPKLLDCPVYFPSGGGVTLTFPIKPEDECLVVFSSRCIDSWWQSGGHSNQQAILRMHDLSDGFAFVGISSVPKVPAAISTSAAQLRTIDGQAYVEVNPASHNVSVVTPATVKAQATTVIVEAAGDVSVTAQGVASVTAPSILLGKAGQTLLSFVTSAFEALFNGHTHKVIAVGAQTDPPLQQMGATHLTDVVKGG